MQSDKYRNNTTGNPERRGNRSNAMLIKKLVEAFHDQRKPKDEKQSNTEINEEKRHDWKDIVSLIIQGVLAVFTAGLFYQTVIQFEEVRKSANAAVLAANQAVKANKISEGNYNLAKQSFDSSLASAKISSIYTQKTAALQEQSVRAQVAALQENQKEYDQQNQPNVQLENFRLLSYDENEIHISFAIVSPNHLAGTISSWNYTIGENMKDALAFINKPFTRHDPDAPYGYINADPYPVRLTIERDKQHVKPGSKSFYFYGAMKYYLSSISDKKMVHRFIIQLFPANKGAYKVVFEKNVPLRK